MKKVKANKGVLILAGVIASVVGIIGAIPSFAGGHITRATLFTILLIAGLILLALGFGD
ncbi:MAG: hypothetical protein KKG60_04115 [Nanoarchaeota archaeon]|nr:hypothetical protein [Nanoarchaeota archaeon]